MYTFGKPLNEINLDDIKLLITNKTKESLTLEYKRDKYHKNIDILKDISAMANASGGHLIIGIEQDNNGAAKNIVRIENAEEEALRIMASCNSAIDEIIRGLDYKIIDFNNTKSILIFFIPKSGRSPHMIAYDKKNQIWVRSATANHRMTIDQVREACLRSENIRKNLEDFLNERKERFLDRIGGDPYFYMSATPLVVKDEIIDIFDNKVRDMLGDPPNIMKGSFSIGPAIPFPSLYGLRIMDDECLILELFRNGHIELSIDINKKLSYDYKNQKAFNKGIKHYPINFLSLTKAIFKYKQILEPCIVCLSLYNINGFYLENSNTHEDSLWDENCHIEIIPRQLNYNFDVEKEAKHLIDRIYQAFHFEKAD
jgi:hypothetical protein